MRLLLPTSLLLLLTGACTPPCPAADQRFDPKVGPENKFSFYGGGLCWNGDFVEESGSIDYVSLTAVECTSDWCAEGYVGTYCTTEYLAQEWFAAHCPRCEQYDYRTGYECEHGCIGGVYTVECNTE